MVEGENLPFLHSRQIRPAGAFEVGGDALVHGFFIRTEADGHRLRLVQPFRTGEEDEVGRFADDVFGTERAVAANLVFGDILPAELGDERAPHAVAIAIAQRVRAVARQFDVHFFR